MKDPRPLIVPEQRCGREKLSTSRELLLRRHVFFFFFFFFICFLIFNFLFVSVFDKRGVVRALISSLMSLSLGSGDTQAPGA